MHHVHHTQFTICITRITTSRQFILHFDEILLDDRKIGPQDLKILPVTIDSGRSASVYAAKWKNTSTIYAIKKSVDNKEIYLMNMANSHKNIIHFHGITKSDDEKKYSLVLEYADSGTLRDYLRNDNITFKWKDQLKLAKEIASAILWLHDDRGIVHGDLHPNNILLHQNTIKVADFGHSCLKGSDNNAGTYGVIPYIDPKFLRLIHTAQPKNVIYTAWGEEPVKNTNAIFVELYQKCWEHEPDKRPDIHQVNSELDSIDSENIDVSTVSSKKSEEESKETKFVHSCQIDIDKIRQKH
ncbi:unnamed protein product [Rhizophagus irregularis]|nr:unnamed protein product [Rhizophagus irregularis]